MSKEGCSGVTGEINSMYSTDMKYKFNKKERKKENAAKPQFGPNLC